MATSTSVATPGVRVPPIGEAGFSTSAAVLPGHVALRTHPECRTAMNSPGTNRALVTRFADFGADPAAVDVSRILRVIGTRNSKSGEVVRLLHQEYQGGIPLTYDFDAFADGILPRPIKRTSKSWPGVADWQTAGRSLYPEHSPSASATSGTRRRFSREDWHWGILEDI